MNRRRLFSLTNRVGGRKLFSDEANDGKHTVMCMDCGYTMDTNITSSKIICPKCGGQRFNVISATPESPYGVLEPLRVKEQVNEERKFSRVSLFDNRDESFQKEFSTPSNNFERNLKLYSGRTLNSRDIEKLFSMSAEDFCNKGYAEMSDNNVKLFSTAYLQDKLFSKLIISVTKEMDLEPSAMECPNKGSFIESLCNRRLPIPPKGIILIKKAHCINGPLNSNPFESENHDWISDSGIENDLSVEYSGQTLGVREFNKILDERYPDAPNDIIDTLIDKGIIDIQGNQVRILK